MTTRSRQFGPQNPGAKVSGDPIQNVFAGRSGSITACKHSQELTPGLLELKATGVFTAFMHVFAFRQNMKKKSWIVSTSFFISYILFCNWHKVHQQVSVYRW